MKNNIFIKINKIEPTEITNDDITMFRNLYSKHLSDMNIDSSYVTAPYLGMDKRIIQVGDVTYVNPVLIESNEPIVYYESDLKKSNKFRKVVRYTYVKLKTDNLGEISISTTHQSWNTIDEMMGDIELMEICILQRMLDSMNGIDNTNPLVRYDISYKNNNKLSRNDKVLLKSPNGDMIFIKNKLSKKYIDIGYTYI